MVPELGNVSNDNDHELLIDVILRMLGFSEKDIVDEGEMLDVWEWGIKRPGAQDLVVRLTERAHVNSIHATDFQFDQRNDRVPNLARVAIISCAEQWPPQKKETVYLPEFSPQHRHVFPTEKAGFFLTDKREVDQDWPAIRYRTAPRMDAVHPDGLSVPYGSIVRGELVNGFLEVQLQEMEARRLNDNGKTVNDVLNENILVELDKIQKIMAWKQHYPDEEHNLSDWCDEYVVHARQES